MSKHCLRAGAVALTGLTVLTVLTACGAGAGDQSDAPKTAAVAASQEPVAAIQPKSASTTCTISASSLRLIKAAWRTEPSTLGSLSMGGILTLENTGPACTFDLSPKVALDDKAGSTADVGAAAVRPEHGVHLAHDQTARITVRVNWPESVTVNTTHEVACTHPFGPVAAVQLTLGGKAAAVPVAKSAGWRGFCSHHSTSSLAYVTTTPR